MPNLPVVDDYLYTGSGRSWRKLIVFCLIIASTAACNGREEVVACDVDPTNQTHDIAPGMMNPEEVATGFEALYNERLRGKVPDDRLVVQLAVYVNKDGLVYDSDVLASSGSAQHDTVALETARLFEFTPAYKDSVPVCARVDLPIMFPPQ